MDITLQDLEVYPELGLVFSHIQPETIGDEVFLESCHRNFLTFHLFYKLDSLGFQFLFLSRYILYSSQEHAADSVFINFTNFTIAATKCYGHMTSYILPSTCISYHVIMRENPNNHNATSSVA